MVIEKEEVLFQKYCTILENFLNGNTELQLVAIYALQVFCYNVGFPKGKFLENAQRQIRSQ